MLPKYAAVAIGSIALTLGLYETIVRRADAIRFLFGPKPRPSRTPVRTAPSPAAVETGTDRTAPGPSTRVR